jgi:signal transduction histidine kinase
MSLVAIDGKRRRPQSPSRRDLAVAVAVGVVEIGVTIGAASHQNPRQPLDVFGVALLLVGAAALVWRRRAPVAVLGVVFATTLAYSLIGYPGGPVYAALIVAFATAGTTGHRRAAWISLLLGYVTFLWVAPLIDGNGAPSLGAVLGLAAWLLVLGISMETVRIRRERALETARHHEEEQRRHASEERLQIARELHDTLAHNLSLINVRAGVALHLLHEQPGPPQAAQALEAIKQASKDALGELRSALDILRADQESAPRAPTPTLGDLSRLVERTAAAGLPVRLEIDGDRIRLPPSMEAAAYRVAQEALTNVVRHAGSPDTEVRLSYQPDALILRVDDNGAGTATNGPPHAGGGLTGMRERVHALGGELDAGPKPGGGFRVRARIPTSSDQ